MSVSIVKANNTWLFTCKYLDLATKQYKSTTRRGFKSRGEAIFAEAKFIEKMESAPVYQITFGEMFYKYMKWRQEMLTKGLSDSYMNDILKPMKATLRYANDYFDMNIEHSWGRRESYDTC